MTNVLEMVTFSVYPGTDETAFVKAADAAGAVLATMPGFVNRRIARGEDGTWADIVEWTDMASAKKAAAVFPTVKAAQPFCSMIARGSTRMAHGLIVSAT
jgi:hypothetical protein